MHGISFHIYKTPHDTWALSYKTGALRHTTMYPTKDDALKASYQKAIIALKN